MSNLSVKVKKILEDIIDLAYKDEPEENRANYKRFFIEIVNKECKTVGGWYMPSKRTIQVHNLSHGSGKTVKTCIHELAHHLDYCKNGKSGHQEPFYAEYRKLLYAALNMRIFTAEDVKSDNWSNDRNKVFKMLSEWAPDYIDYNTDSVTISVTNGYEQRMQLKSHGYGWDGIQQVWSKEISSEELETEEEFLSAHGLEYRTSEGAELNIDAVGYIIADGRTYDAKEALKEEGFFFSSKGKKPAWKKKVVLGQAKEEIERLHKTEKFKEVIFKIGK